MSGISNDLANYGLVGRIGGYAVTLDRRETDLTAQSTSGLIASNVTDLGVGTSQVLNLQPQVSQLAAYGENATIAGDRLTAAQTTLSSIGSIASDMATGLTSLAGESGTTASASISTLAIEAKAALGSLMGLLNTSAGDSYVFGAAGSSAPPVSDPSTAAASVLASGAAAIAGLSANGAASTIASISAGVAGAAIFDPSQMPAGTTTIQVGAGETVAVGFTATSPYSASAPTQTSFGDLIGVLSAVANLSPTNGQASDFSDLVSGLRTVLGQAQSGISSMVSTLGVSQQTVSAASDTNAALTAALTTQIGDLTSVDLPTVATQLTATQNQITASYEIINALRGMTLAAYL